MAGEAEQAEELLGGGDRVSAGRASARRRRCANGVTAALDELRRLCANRSRARHGMIMSHEARAVIAEDERQLAPGAARRARRSSGPSCGSAPRSRTASRRCARSTSTRPTSSSSTSRCRACRGWRWRASQRPLPRGVRHRVRRVRRPGIRAGRGRLRAEAALDCAPRDHGRAPEGAHRQRPGAPRRPARAPRPSRAAGGHLRWITASQGARDPPDHGRRDLLLPLGQQVHLGGHRGGRGADPRLACAS